MEYIALKDVCKINMGQSPESSSYNENGDGIPFFQGNADFGERYPVTRVWCSAPTKVAYTGDILISVRAPIGALNYAKEECCIGRGLAAITPDLSKISSDFIFWLLKGKNEELNSKGTGSTFKAIGRKVLEETLVPDYSFEQQHVCADNLEKVYSIIQLRKQELLKLDDLIKARFVELFEIEQGHYDECHLEDIADIVSGITKGRKTKCTQLREVPYMAVSNVKDGYIDWTTVKTILATEDEIEQYRLLPNDVLMTEGGDPDKVGRGSIISDPPEDCIHQNHIFRVRLDETRLLPRYFASFLQSPVAKMYFLSAAKQTTGIASINMKQLRGLPTILPPLNKQKEFVLFCQQVDKSKFEVQRSLDEAQKLFDSLMQEYFF